MTMTEVFAYLSTPNAQNRLCKHAARHACIHTYFARAVQYDWFSGLATNGEREGSGIITERERESMCTKSINSSVSTPVRLPIDRPSQVAAAGVDHRLHFAGNFNQSELVIRVERDSERGGGLSLSLK
ncbi:hypothetical protein BO79DRAFT_221574 [Aspergillus costaricaensis CBS 115574]|uniref:Uncharacterized protein n=1 Tax=Aspergillus costaricaensis CBS 115574 TaxID=1448317 RepID=A0ACD1I2Q6_9EURO|nr:hypothetical protein BO79DRAFT_221574 [Aspergillus costaricaensis CBS 115574]RAK84587.1 hypothetical protein BO79DRAFT_221574 [Aspergillus costaricaensis CBS 115574]